MKGTNTKKYPLTKSQLLIWAGQKLNPDAPLYNMVHSFEIDGEIDISVFQRAFQELVDRVDALRTVFIDVQGDPVQEVLGQLEYELPVFFLKETESEIAREEWIFHRSQKKLDLSKLLFDSALLSCGQNKFIWYLNIHHIATDATSTSILYDLMATLYAHCMNGTLSQMVNVPSFLSYVSFEKLERERPYLQRVKHYWSQKIERINVVSGFYGKKQRPKTTEAIRITVPFGRERSLRLKQLAERSDIRSWTSHLTLFNLFSLALFSFLNRISGQKTITIGAPTHNRVSKIHKETPGLFIEVFPMVVSVENDETFESLLQKIKLETNEFLKYGQPGLSTPAISASYNAVINYLNNSFTDFNGLPVKSRWIHPGHCDPGHQIRCHIYDLNASGEIEVYFDLNKDIFDSNLSAEVPNHFLNLVDSLLSDLNQPIQRPALTAVPKIIDKPGTVKDENQDECIISLFGQCAKANADCIALRANTLDFTYGELNEKANQLANYLKSFNIGQGDCVAVYLERSPEYIIGVLAILKTGGNFIPIPSDQPAKRVAYILADSGCSLVLTDTRLKKNIKPGTAEIIDLKVASESIENQSYKYNEVVINPSDIAYIIYTSGSTGNPKGVLISHGAILNYLNWAKRAYATSDKFIFPLFTSIGFDLTITATFLPLITGGELVIYKGAGQGPDISLMEVLADNKVNSIKLTPSHLALLQGTDLSHSRINTMIVGGEDFKTNLAATTQMAFGETLRIYNEYGPTEATVGCIVSQFDRDKHNDVSVPIGTPIDNMQAYILDSYNNIVPKGVIGELYLGGTGLAEGYANLPALTQDKFIENPFVKGAKIYHTGDLARENSFGELEYLGRADEQIKLRGFRIEPSDIEANMLSHNAVTNAAVVLIENEKSVSEDEVVNCVECGLPSNYPNTDFDEKGVCHLCNAFKGYKDEAQRYFKTTDELRDVLTSKRGKNPNYDCLSLLSGGKDSTYILAQLIGMGLKVLAFTLDNGYISDQAKNNIDKIVKKLGVDHIYGTTEHMNKIFVDSLHRHHNVCNGCFKTIYTLSTQIALEKEIPFVVTGLSRGQFFETRLTEELFWDEDVDVDTIDKTILEARKLYHQEEDAVKNLLDVSMFNTDTTFEKVQFIDFYRYSDVKLEEMLTYLKEKVGWVRPTDTGRSTNCLINQVGIYVHKKQKGYSNYAFPYSWDVRMGHKTRKETLDEINEFIDEKEVKRITDEIGYQEPGEDESNHKKLVAYYTGGKHLSAKELHEYLKMELPDYMLPSHFKFMEELPLTLNGKVDKTALKALNSSQLDMDTPFVAPEGEIEEILAAIWKEVLRLKQVGVHDDFIALGGHSLAAIRVTARINEEIEMNFPLNKIFELPTIAEYSKFIEDTLVELLKE